MVGFVAKAWRLAKDRLRTFVRACATALGSPGTQRAKVIVESDERRIDTFMSNAMAIMTVRPLDPP